MKREFCTGIESRSGFQTVAEQESIKCLHAVEWSDFKCNEASGSFPKEDCCVELSVNEPIVRRTEQVTEQVRRLILAIGNEPKAAVELMDLLELKHRPSFQQTHLRPASELGVIEMTLPDKPWSQNQKYLLTALGRKVREKLESADDEH